MSNDPARSAAFDVLRAVAAEDAYANLVLPRMLAERAISGRDAAFATELGYGTLRCTGTLDAILSRCVDRELSALQPAVLDLLRLGAYQLLRTRVPSHAAVATTVDLSRASGNARAAGLVNAVLRRVAARDWDGWAEQVSAGASAVEVLAARHAHPSWIAQAFADALGGDLAELEAALAADDARPVTHLVAWPGRIDRDELARAADATAGPWSPYAVRMSSGGAPRDLAAIREHRAGVQDEGSQLCAIALANAPITGRDERWLDLCAGPGGKTALLAALALPRGARVTANELHRHRAELVRQASEPWDVEVIVGDARALPGGDYDRVLLDAPCTGLGALRRRPEARWRRRPEDLAELAALQRDLLGAARRLVRPGGVIGYVTCSPHPAETGQVVAGSEFIDARALLPGLPQLGDGPTVQLWPHRHGTDAMFLALIRGEVGATP